MYEALVLPSLFGSTCKCSNTYFGFQQPLNSPLHTTKDRAAFCLILIDANTLSNARSSPTHRVLVNKITLLILNLAECYKCKYFY